MSEITFRVATEADAEAFVAWATDNPDIPTGDIQAALTNPSAQTFVFERDGQILSFLPFYCLIRIAFLGFNPDLSNMDKGRVLKVMLKAITEFARKYSIAEISTLSKDGYGIAEWAKKKGFESDPRQVFTLKVI